MKKSRFSEEQIAYASSSACDVAGFHIPIGPIKAMALAQYQPWLQGPTSRWWTLVASA